jgi:hypothetical protein
MSITSIPNQPIIFNPTVTSCNCGDDNLKQLVDFEDQIFFQIELGCGSQTFYEQRAVQTIWTSSGGNICNDGTSGGSYRFEIEPDEIYDTFVFNLVVETLTSGTLFVLMEGGQQYEITTPGTYALYFNTDIMQTDLKPLITLSGDDFNGCFLANLPIGLGLAGIYSNHTFYVVDENNDVVISGADYRNVSEQYLTVGFDFDLHDIDAGCYRLAYADECDNTCGQFRITNGYFTYDGGWTLENGAVINASTNILTFTQVGTDAPAATNDTAICENKQYYVEFKLNSITGGSVVATVGNSATLGQFVSGNAAGVYSGTITSTLGTDFLIRLSGSNGNVAVIDYVICRFADAQAPELDGFSNELSVGDYSGCEFVKLEGCNGNDSFGFKFVGSGFVPGIRVEKRFFRPQFVTDVEVYRDSKGLNRTNFADVQKIKTLRVEQQPEYFFDFLSLLVYFDNFYVNAVTYILNEPDFPSIEWNDANESGSINLELKLKQELLRKVNCTDVDADCLPTVLRNDDNYLLLQNGDRLVLQNGDNLLLQG